jgi:hypothetical protein
MNRQGKRIAKDTQWSPHLPLHSVQYDQIQYIVVRGMAGSIFLARTTYS